MSKIWILVAGLLIILGMLFLLFGPKYFDQPTVLTASTFALVFVTLFYTIATFFMVGEIRQTRENEYRPEVIIDFDGDPKHTDLICFVVRNIGRRPARDVKFSFKPEPVNWRGVNIAKTGAFENGIRFLSPGRTMQWRYESFSNLVGDSASKPLIFQVIIDYKDIRKSGGRERDRSFRETFPLDANQFMEQYVVDSKSADKSLEKMSKICILRAIF